MSLARLAVLDLWRKRAVAAVQLVGLVTALALSVALPLMQSVAAEEGLHSALRSLGPGTNLEIGVDHVADPAPFDAFQAETSRRVTTEMGPILIPAARFARSNQQQPMSLNGVGLIHEPGDPLPVASYYEGLEAHVAVTSGAWPADGKTGDAWWATVPESGASLLGLKVGDVYCLGPSGASRNAPAPWCVKIGAVWKPLRTSDPYWAGQPPGTELMLGRSSLFDVRAPYVSLHAAQLYVTDIGRVHAADADGIRFHLQRLRGAYGVTSNATFITGLGDAIQVFLSRLRAQQILAVSVEIALLAVALFAIGLSAIHFLDAQRPLVGLWRARGGSRLRAWGLLMLQLGVLALTALPVGALIGVSVVALIGARLFGGADVLEAGILLTAGPTVIAVLVAIGAVLGLLAADATRRTVSEVRRTESRPPVTAWWQRRGADAVLALAGILLIAEFRLQAGEISTSSGPDPLGLILPGVALALLALASLRLLPLVARLLAGGPGLGTRLARWRLEREPLQHARVALLLSFALALSLFTSAYLATDQRNALDRARYAAGSDVRVGFGFGTAPSVVDGAIASAPGVVASSLVYRGEGRPGRADVAATVMGVDGYTFGRVASWRDDFADRSLAQLMSAMTRGDPDGVAIPGRPQALSLWVYSSGIDATMSAALRGADGRPVHATFGRLTFQGWQSLQAPLAGLTASDFPLRLRSLAVTPARSTAAGEVDISELRAGPPVPASPVVEAFSTPDRWWHETIGAFGGVGPVTVGPRVHDGKPSVQASVGLGGGVIALRPMPSSAPLPGVISSPTAAKLGIGIGQSFPLHIETNDINVRLVGTTDYFPTLYPGQDDYLLLPSDSLTERLRQLSAYVYPNEAWLRVSGSPADAGAAVESATHGQAHVTDRETLEHAALSSPLRLSLDAALVIGFAAALTMVVIGFGLHFLAAARRRVSESAIMQANGLPWSVVDRGLFIEQAVVLGYSLAVGALLGAVMAWAILPVLQTSVLPEELIPPTIVTLDPRTLVVATIALLAAAAIVGWLAIRSAGRFRLAEELRALA